MIISIISLFVSIITIVVSCMFAAASRRRQAALTTYYCNVENIHEAIPELLMIDSPPIAFHIGKKKLYVKAFTARNSAAFLSELVKFLRNYSTQLEGIKLYEFDELQEMPDSNKLIEETLKFFGKKEILTAFSSVINKVLLSDRAANPNRITKRYLLNNVTPNQLCQIFYALYAYNIGSEKKNLQALLSLIGAASSGGKATELLEYSKRVATGQTNGSDSPYRENPFFPQHLRKSQTGTSENENKAEKRGRLDGNNSASTD